MPSAEQMEAILHGRLDVGFVHLPTGVADLTSEPVESHAMVAAIPSRHPLARRRTIPWSALEGEAFIGFPRTAAPGAYDAIMARLREVGLVPRVVHETDSLLARLRLVGAGLGVSLVPEYARNFNHAGVALRPLASPPARTQIGMVHFPPRHTPALGRFMDVVRELAER